MPPPEKTVLEALEFLSQNIQNVQITETQENKRLMGKCEAQIDNILKYLGLHEDQHPDVFQTSTKKNSITPLRICPGGKLHSRE